MIRSAIFLALVAGLLGLASTEPSPSHVVALPGWVIFDPTRDGFAYRYGPSFLVTPDGQSVDAYFASPGGPAPDGSSQWDWIRYRHSTDGGHTWSPEQIVLKATPGSRDRQSVCDPAAIKLGDWYYLGVTAVEDPKGMDNEVFVAKSRAPTGPFEKWNGQGWGGTHPMPLLPFRNPSDVWGLGEPSFVRVDESLFIYYTESTRDSASHRSAHTRVATAPADAPDWPAHLTQHGICFQRARGEDSADVKFDDGTKQFIAVTTADRMGPKAHVNLRWSTDGFSFGDPASLEGPVKPRCHNVGLSGTSDGHLLHKGNFVAYAYGDGSRPDPSWAFWYTFLNPIEVGQR